MVNTRSDRILIAAMERIGQRALGIEVLEPLLLGAGEHLANVQVALPAGYVRAVAVRDVEAGWVLIVHATWAIGEHTTKSATWGIGFPTPEELAMAMVGIQSFVLRYAEGLRRE